MIALQWNEARSEGSQLHDDTDWDWQRLIHDKDKWTPIHLLEIIQFFILWTTKC